MQSKGSQRTGNTSSLRGPRLQTFHETALYNGNRIAIRRCCKENVKLTPELESELGKVKPVSKNLGNLQFQYFYFMNVLRIFKGPILT